MSFELHIKFADKYPLGGTIGHLILDRKRFIFFFQNNI